MPGLGDGVWVEGIVLEFVAGVVLCEIGGGGVGVGARVHVVDVWDGVSG